MELEIKDLHVEAEGKEIVKGLNLKVKEGELHVIMGPNGSGKTTLAKAIMGHPDFKIASGSILVDGKAINGLLPNERARLGLFLEFQNPTEIEGLGIINFLNTARNSLGKERQSVKDFMSNVNEHSKKLKMKEGLVGRSLNFGFSGGEKKKVEILQMAVLEPKIAILDEPDSGLDIDAVKTVAENINEYRKRTNAGIVLITHYSRILNYMDHPDAIHIMSDGKIVKEGGRQLIEQIEKEGYGLDGEGVE